MKLRVSTWAAWLALALTGCGEKRGASPLPQRAYVWQRDWNAPVVPAITENRDVMAGIVVLGAEIEWQGRTPRAVKPRVDWAALSAAKVPMSIALRVAPVSLSFESDDENARFICSTARELIAAAAKTGVAPQELQLDFDCAQKKLSGYATWIRAVRDAVKPVPLVITTLPAWLDEPEFPALVKEASRYVLQVHSIRAPKGGAAQLICDPALARKWVQQASKIGVPFEIALPTYRYRAGFDADGKFIGIDSDSVRPSWPGGTRVTEFATDPAAMATLVQEWTLRRPKHCQGIIWYRLPLASDRNNWPMSTMRAVMQGRAPRSLLNLRVNGAAPDEQPSRLNDLSVINDGETDEPPRGRLVVSWTNADARAAAEALPGWEVTVNDQAATFVPKSDAQRLPPGAERAIGWLRLEPAATIHVEIIR